MSKGSTTTESVYECSRESAAITIDNTHWINQFSEGIKLNKGDQVRLLGSFIQEGANSNEIEISEDQELNITYSPYILGNTIDTIDKTKNGNLMDLSQIGDLAYSTDSFGIEPPMRNTTQKGEAGKDWQQVNMGDGNDSVGDLSTPYPNNTESIEKIAAGSNRGAIDAYDNMADSNPAATGEQGGDVYGSYRYNPWFINGAQQGELPNYTGWGGVAATPQTEATFDAARQSMRGDSAITWGTNLKTDKFNTSPSANQSNSQTYKNFSDNSVPTEMYVGHMIKKLILPILDVFSTGNTDADPTGTAAAASWEANATAHQLEPLLDNATASGQPGCLAGIPRAGMYIATIDIAQSSGWFDINGNGYFENKWGTEVGGNNADYPGFPEYSGLDTSKFGGAAGDTGKVNLKSGVQSVIGEILAVRFIKQHILGRTQNCYEIYVSNFVNPGTIDGFNPNGHVFETGSVTNAATLAVNNDPIRLFKRPHGGSSGDNGYNFNPSFNTINGALNKVPIGEVEYWSNAGGKGFDQNGLQTRGYKQGQNSGTPLGYNYIQNDGTITPSPATDVANGGDADSATQEDMGLGNPEGLSFLWNGTHTGYRKTNWNYGNINRYRANCLMQPYRLAGAFQDQLRLKHLITDIIYEQSPTGIAQPGIDRTATPADQNQKTTFIRDAVIKQQGSVPVCLGAYIICHRDTMLDIAKGNLDSNSSNNFYSAQPGLIPRVWFDWAFQARQSEYTTRHYVGNTWSVRNCEQGESNTDGGKPDRWPHRFPGKATIVEENRWGYSFMGRPNNINWRQSVVNNGNGATIAERQVQNTNFYAPAYTNWWRLTADSGTGDDLINQTDKTPIYMSTLTGEQEAVVDDQGFNGLPLVWAGYNTCCNSIYFQQKDTGDVNLGFGSWRAKASVSVAAVAGGQTIGISTDLIDIDTGATRTLPIITDDKTGIYQIKVLYDNCQFNPVELITTITAVPLIYTITLLTSTRKTIQGPASGAAAPVTNNVIHNDAKWVTDIPNNIGISVIIYYKSSGGVGAGIDATPWSSDLLMIKENIAKYKVPAGFYSEEQLAEEVNNALHFDAENYTNEYGVKGVNNTRTIPTNVGKSSYARASQPSIVNGPFQQTYLPDVSFGFTPITSTNSADLEQAAQTKELTSELYTYELLKNAGGEIIYTWPENMLTERPYDGISVRKITDDPAEYPTKVGKHLKIYSVPKTISAIADSDSKTKELCLMRLRGGALNETDFPKSTDKDSNGRWGNVVPRMVGNMEMLRATDICYWVYDNSGGGDPIFPYYNSWWQSTAGVYMYRTRLTRSLFPNGGSARVICGANNLTFSWEEGANRFSLNNLYTPIRPHQVENPDNTKTNDFGIGDAVPSAIISAKGNGNVVTQLTGIYINDLNAPSFTQTNWGVPGLDEYWEYDTETDTQTEKNGLELLSIFGYTEAQVNANINSFDIVENPFTFKNKLRKNGSAIRVGAKITPAINSSNPTASRCLNIAPVQQFFVQVDSDDFFAENVPLKGNSPYYFIGSNFPSKQFYGNLNGAKLPIVGICSRNFSAFNFVFDLGGSAISFLINENTTITHIETKIYDSQMKTPSNLSPSSSVIYLITRFNYAPGITNPQEQQNALNIMIADNQAPILNEFYSQPTANIRTELPAIIPPMNNPYFTGFGQMVPAIPEEEEDSDDDY